MNCRIKQPFAKCCASPNTRPRPIHTLWTRAHAGSEETAMVTIVTIAGHPTYQAQHENFVLPTLFGYFSDAELCFLFRLSKNDDPILGYEKTVLALELHGDAATFGSRREAEPWMGSNEEAPGSRLASRGLRCS
jgi:hypothetical protein